MMFLHQEVQNLMNFILSILKLLFTSYFIDQIWEHRACTPSLLPIHGQATRTWKGKNFSPPLKNSQNFFPPGLRGCPCGDFPPPIWNFGQIFPPHLSFGIKIH